jgi:hypothetical protein
MSYISHELKDYNKALDYGKKAYEIYQKALGKDNQHTKYAKELYSKAI